MCGVHRCFVCCSTLTRLSWFCVFGRCTALYLLPPLTVISSIEQLSVLYGLTKFSLFLATFRTRHIRLEPQIEHCLRKPYLPDVFLCQTRLMLFLVRW